MNIDQIVDEVLHDQTQLSQPVLGALLKRFAASLLIRIKEAEPIAVVRDGMYKDGNKFREFPQAPPTAETRCPTCDSPDPKLHPAVQYEGEVQECDNAFHGTPAEPARETPLWIRAWEGVDLEEATKHAIPGKGIRTRPLRGVQKSPTPAKPQLTPEFIAAVDIESETPITIGATPAEPAREPSSNHGPQCGDIDNGPIVLTQEQSEKLDAIRGVTAAEVPRHELPSRLGLDEKQEVTARIAARQSIPTSHPLSGAVEVEPTAERSKPDDLLARVESLVNHFEQMGQSQIQETKRDIKSGIVDLQRRLEAAEEKTSRLEETIADHNTHVARKNTEICDQIRANHKLQKCNEECAEYIAELETQLGKVATDYDNRGSEIVKLQQRLDDATTSRNDWRGAAKALESRIVDLESQLAATQPATDHEWIRTACNDFMHSPNLNFEDDEECFRRVVREHYDAAKKVVTTAPVDTEWHDPDQVPQSPQVVVKWKGKEWPAFCDNDHDFVVGTDERHCLNAEEITGWRYATAREPGLRFEGWIRCGSNPFFEVLHREQSEHGELRVPCVVYVHDQPQEGAAAR